MTTIVDTAGDQTVTGSVGNDLISLGAGNDTLTGAGGVDRFIVSGQIGTDSISDFGSTDLLFFYGVFADAAALDAASTVEGGNLVIRWTVDGEAQELTLTGVTSTSGIRLVPGAAGGNETQGDDTLIGDAGVNELGQGTQIYDNDPDFMEQPPTGHDLMFGLDGDDWLFTGYNPFGDETDQNDSLAYGGEGNDYIVVAGYAFGEGGDDTLVEFDEIRETDPEISDFNNTTYYGGLAHLFGGDGDDTLFGGTWLDGGAGNDLVIATLPDAVAVGGEGYDALYLGGSGYDFSLAGGFEEILIAGSGVLTDNLAGADETLRVAGYEVDGSAETDAELILVGTTLKGGAMDDILVSDGYDIMTAWGGAGDDMMIGGEARDRLIGGAGNDFIYGGLGSDLAIFSGLRSAYTITYRADGAVIVSGPDGEDEIRSVDTLRFADMDVAIVQQDSTIDGTPDDDVLYGGSGEDTIDGKAGADWMEGDLGDDTYIVDNAWDEVFESYRGGSDTIFSSVTYDAPIYVERLVLTGTADIDGWVEGNGSIVGNSGANALSGAGANVMEGGAGDDTYCVNSRLDTIVELAGGGIDRVLVGMTYQLIDEIENGVLTGTGDFRLTGNAASNELRGNVGNNRLDGGAGGIDTLYGGEGDDTFIIRSTTQTVIELADEGIDLVSTDLAFDLRKAGQTENLLLTGTASVLGIGNELDNILIGNSGANKLNGLGGADRMIGGDGNDTYTVDNVGDRVRELAGGGTDRVNSSVSFNGSGQDIEILALTGAAAANLTAGAIDNTLIGNGAANILNGGAGVDRMLGGLGNDIYYVDQVGDKLVEFAGEGLDRVYTTIDFQAQDQEIEQIYLAGTGDIDAVGNAQNNVICGNVGDNVITGGIGKDQLYGKAGEDTFVYESIADSSISQYDRIRDLDDEDIIDLSAIDANVNVAGNQAFSLVDSFTGQAGQIILTKNVENYYTLLSADVNGDGVADMRIVLDGNHLDFFHFTL